MAGKVLTRVYEVLYAAYGAQHWWPARDGFEMTLGAILTQNTRWENVEKAIANMRSAGVTDAAALLTLDEAELQRLIRPAGFFRQKSRYLRCFAAHIVANYSGDVTRLLAGELLTARAELLSLPGIGPETADSMLLYGGGQAIFVIDAYTRRICARLGLTPPDADYATLQALFSAALPADAKLFNEYHALLVRHAKEFCTSRAPRCAAGCPLAQKIVACPGCFC